MAKKVLVLDTSILCVWLDLPGMNKIEKKGEKTVLRSDVETKVRQEIKRGSGIVLPLASVIECGNHITQIKGIDPKIYIDKFAEFVQKSIRGEEPWDIFTNQINLFNEENFTKLINDWRTLSVSRISMGDASIIQVANHYSDMGYIAEIYTGDTELKSYEPCQPKPILPRNRNRR